ncbi:MAG: hypothetical protein V4690_00985 [Patescibacteria group bacterium]
MLLVLFVILVILTVLTYIRQPKEYYYGPFKIVDYYDGVSCVYERDAKWNDPSLACMSTEILNEEKVKLIPPQNLRVL